MNKLSSGYFQVDRTLARHLPTACREAVPAEQFENQMGEGEGVSPGFARGKITTSLEPSVNHERQNQRAILVAPDFRIDHLGYLESLAAMVSKGRVIPHHLKIALRYSGVPALKNAVFAREPREGEEVIIDCFRGKVYPATERNIRVLSRAVRGDSFALTGARKGGSSVRIRANADTKSAIRNAFDNGAEGIGLCRTGYIFFRRELKQLLYRFVAENDRRAGRRILEAQEADFADILAEVPPGFPIAVRLWDNPLGDFFREFGEANPALGTRGVRLGLAHPDIYRLQIRALIGAFEKMPRERKPILEALIPFVSFPQEYERWADYIKRRAPDVKLGCMIETPAIVMRTGALAGKTDLLCVGTNDLTQTTLGISRDDYEAYAARCGRIYETNPFEALDGTVETLLLDLISTAKKANPAVEIGIVGAQASFPDNLRFLVQAGFDYLSVNFREIGALRVLVERIEENGKHESGGEFSWKRG